MKRNESLLANLEKNLPPEEFTKLKAKLPEKIIRETQEDYEYSRDGMKRLIERSEQAIEILYNLAEEAEHPRVFEVLSGMIKNTSDMMENLLALQERRKKLNSSDDSNGDTINAPKTVNNTQIVFNGSATDLQRMFSNDQIKKAIDGTDA